MPPIKIQHVVSCSSEDKVHKGENLLSKDHYRKWKCANTGEKQITIILQLEKETKIYGIDIGNEGSALVEVLVGRSSDHKLDYEVLLVTSSFMSPKDAKQETNLNQVRMFGLDKLTQAVANEKWDRVKIVCSQPFNNNMKYGLSFVVLHSPESASESTTKVDGSPKLKLGAFKMKSDEKEEDTVTVGSFFNKMKGESKNTTSTPTTGPLAIRNASQNGTSTETKSSFTPKPKKLSPVAQSTNANDKAETVSSDRKRKATEDEKPSSKDHKRNGEKPSSSEQKKKINKSEEKPSSSQKTEKPFHRIMSDVVFVLSGYQNPQRSTIRDQALAMGATYRQDWVKECTHLLCAFANTPKYNQVKRLGGKIVNEKWILESYKRRKVLPWKKFKLGQESDYDSTEEEIETPKKAKPSSPKKPKLDTAQDEKPKASSADDSDTVYDAPTDVDESDVDTEDELARVKAYKDKKKRAKNDVTKLPPLPDFFSDKMFFCYGDFDAQERQRLERYVVGCNGKISNYMNNKIDFVLTNSKWDTDFDDALLENKKLKIVKPNWVQKCLEAGDFVPPLTYFVKRER